MGINRSAFKLLVEENIKRPFNGNVLLLGNQYYFLNREETIEALKSYDLDIAEKYLKVDKDPKQQEGQFIDFKSILNYFGFDHIDVMDYSDYEGANIIHDLNQIIQDKKLKNKYDLIIDGGTIEHVFHVPNVLQNFYELLNINGRIIHFAPSSNHVDHGFYMFSPTLFYDYYSANDYKIEDFYFYSYVKDDLYGFWTLYEYFPGALHRLQLGGLDDKLYGVYCVCTKNEKSTFGKIPQQSMYSNGLWIKDEKRHESIKNSNLKEFDFNKLNLKKII